MRHRMIAIVAVFCVLCGFTAKARASKEACPLTDEQARDAGKLPSCSYSALNGNCRVTINRFKPVTPPTIYVKPECKVYVVVQPINGYKLEHLTLDWKQGSIVLPPDVFSTVFTAISPNLGKLSVTRIKTNQAPLTCENQLYLCQNSAAVSEAQERVLQQIAASDPVPKLKDTITDINTALLPPPVPLPSATDPKQAWYDASGWLTRATQKIDAAVPSEAGVKLLHRQRLNLDADVTRFTSESQSEVKNAQTLLMKAEKSLAQAQAEVDASDKAVRENQPNSVALKQKADDGLRSAQRDQFRAEADLRAAFLDAQGAEEIAANEAFVDQNDDELETLTRRLEALSGGMKGLTPSSGGIEGANTISDPDPTDNNYQNQVWNLNYVNELQPITKRVAADTLKSGSSSSLGGIADPSPKQTIVSITVQFQNPLPVEASAGLMVPFTPYHSYAKSTDSLGNPIAQETTSYALVPIALVNVPFKQWIVHKQPSAIFASGGVGVNSVTSAVEFGAGLTFSYRSFEISALADIGRDSKLTGGITPNGSLGSYGAPPTQSVWQVRPSAAIGIRIPIGGASSGH